MRCTRNNPCKHCEKKVAKKFRKGKRFSRRDFRIFGWMLSAPIRHTIDYERWATICLKIVPVNPPIDYPDWVTDYPLKGE